MCGGDIPNKVLEIFIVQFISVVHCNRLVLTILRGKSSISSLPYELQTVNSCASNLFCLAQSDDYEVADDLEDIAVLR